MAHLIHCIFVLFSYSALAVHVGFNYGSTFSDGTPKEYADFFNEFTTSQNLGISGLSSVRLYTSIQAGTVNTPISAIQAAKDTGSSLLLGLWASSDDFGNEIAALKNISSTADAQLADLIIGISVGSEDLYRLSSGDGDVDAVTLVDYIQQARGAVANTLLSSKLIGHVDTWQQWTITSNIPVVNASDFIGCDAYPYYQYNDANSIDQASTLFDEAFNATMAAVGSKPVWVTETGWPVSGPDVGLAVPSSANAQTYWQTVGCRLFGSVNTWWYELLQDTAITFPNFGVIGPGNFPAAQPFFSMACGA